MDSGWIKLYRSMTSCKTASRGLNFFGAMAWLVVKANYEDGWYKGDKIGRGQLFVGLSYLAKEWKVGIRVVRTILQHLEIDEFLTSKSTNKGRIITICNYDSYQMLPDDYRQADRQATDKQPTSNRQATDNFQELKEVKELKNNTNTGGSCLPGFAESSITPDGVSFKKWTPEQFRRSVASAGTEYSQSMLDDFCGYWLEPLPNGKPRFTKQEAWCVSRRLATWAKNHAEREKDPENTPDDEWERIIRQCANQ